MVHHERTGFDSLCEDLSHRNWSFNYLSSSWSGESSCTTPRADSMTLSPAGKLNSFSAAPGAERELLSRLDCASSDSSGDVVTSLTASSVGEPAKGDGQWPVRCSLCSRDLTWWDWLAHKDGRTHRRNFEKLSGADLKAINTAIEVAAGIQGRNLVKERTECQQAAAREKKEQEASKANAKQPISKPPPLVKSPPRTMLKQAQRR